MRKLRDYLTANEESLELGDLLKVWHGFFYCYWMSDKEEIQHEFSRALASSMHLWGPEFALTYFDAFLQTMNANWSKIDHDRMNKYLSLARRMLEASFIYLRVCSWDPEIVSAWAQIVSACIRQGHNGPRGFVLHIAEIYIHSWATACSQDVYFNELNIEELLANSKYDDSMTLEDIYYHKYLYRKQERHGKEAQARFHARKMSKRAGAAPLDRKHTREGRREAKLAAGRPTNPDGKLVHTNPIAYLLHKRTKKEKTEDTPKLSAEIERASRELTGPTPIASSQIIMDVFLNAFKLATSDVALREVLHEHFHNKFLTIVRRFVKDMQCAEQGVENDCDEIVEDALGMTCAIMLRTFVKFLRDKARSNPNDMFVVQTKTKKINVAKLGLQELPLTTKTRGFLNGFASSLEHFITRLLALGIDFDELEAQSSLHTDAFSDGEGDGEGEHRFDPSIFDDGEGELTEEQMQAFMDEMGDEDFEFDDGDDDDDDDDDDEEEEEEEEEPPQRPIANIKKQKLASPSSTITTTTTTTATNPKKHHTAHYSSDDEVQLGQDDEDDFDGFEGDSDGFEGEFDGFEGEFDPFLYGYGEGEDGMGIFDYGEGEFE
jgi:hypothetical protein